MIKAQPTAPGCQTGSGSITSPLIVESNGTIGAGSPNAIGTFTVSNDIVLSGNLFIRSDKSLAQPNDKIVATGIITNADARTVIVTNTGGPCHSNRVQSTAAAINSAGVFGSMLLNRVHCTPF